MLRFDGKHSWVGKSILHYGDINSYTKVDVFELKKSRRILTYVRAGVLCVNTEAVVQLTSIGVVQKCTLQRQAVRSKPSAATGRRTVTLRNVVECYNC